MSVIYGPEYRALIGSLKDCRLQSGMTQQELAAKLGRRQAYVSKYEQGQKRLDAIEVRNICMCLGVSFPKMIAEFEKRLNQGGTKK